LRLAKTLLQRRAAAKAEWSEWNERHARSEPDWRIAAREAVSVKQGLVAALFSTSPALIDDFLRRAQAGILKINSSTADAAVDLPFGGWKASGIGPPEHYPANHEFFTRWQATYFPRGESDR
jgi:acyl-CoA reductase-like NAD-dependent aldehyde dehydrogenase